MKVILETERLILRQFTENDLDNLVSLDRDPQVMRFINGGKPTEIKIIKYEFLPKILKYYRKYENFGFWASIEKSSKEFIGWFCLRPILDSKYVMEINQQFPLVNHDDFELGYRLRRSKWNQGYATEGSKKIIYTAFHQWGVQNIVAVALKANKASTRVMEKVGFKLATEFYFHEHQLPLLTEEKRLACLYKLSKHDLIEV